jgi:dCMP deaminase
MKVARSTNNARGATLYLTHSPCKDCSKLILQAGIQRLVYLDPYKDPSGLELLRSGGVMVHKLEAL